MNKIKSFNHFIILAILFILITQCSGNTDLVNTNENDYENIEVSSEEYKEYLNNNYSVLDLEDNEDYSSFSMLDTYIEDNEIFLTGEAHGVAANKKADLKFLKYFKEKAGIKYYLVESGYSSVQYLNKYIETGDEDILNNLFKPSKGTYGWTIDAFNLYKKYREFNQSLASEERILFIGIDVEHQIETAIKYLYELLPEKSPPEEIVNHIKSLKNLFENGEHKYNFDKVDTFSFSISNNIKSQIQLYEEYLGDNFFHFKQTVKGIVDRFYCYNTSEKLFSKRRDKSIYENFLIFYNRLPKGKYYGQWGGAHIYQVSCNNIDYMASLMNNSNDSPVRGKIISIYYNYENCKQMTKPTNNNSYSERDFQFSFSYVSEIEPDSNSVLFNLTGNNSPYKKISFDNDSSITDYFQFIFLLRNSEATKPFGNG